MKLAQVLLSNQLIVYFSVVTIHCKPLHGYQSCESIKSHCAVSNTQFAIKPDCTNASANNCNDAFVQAVSLKTGFFMIVGQSEIFYSKAWLVALIKTLNQYLMVKKNQIYMLVAPAF